jgi:hypothetical protein
MPVELSRYFSLLEVYPAPYARLFLRNAYGKTLFRDWASRAQRIYGWPKRLIFFILIKKEVGVII